MLLRIYIEFDIAISYLNSIDDDDDDDDYDDGGDDDDDDYDCGDGDDDDDDDKILQLFFQFSRGREVISKTLQTTRTHFRIYD